MCEAGFILSTLWIAMARGSKTAYERIEDGINLFHERCNNLIDPDIVNLNRKMWFDRLWSFGTSDLFPRHGTLPFPSKVNPHSDLNTGVKTGFFYSVSKINTALGYIFLASWILLLFVSFKIGIAYLTYSISSFIILILFDFAIVFPYCNFLVLSDNGMEFPDYIQFIRSQKKHPSPKNADDRQWAFIKEFFNQDSNNVDKEIVRNNVINKLNDYKDNAEDSSEKTSIEKIVKASKDSNISLSMVRSAWQGYYKTKYILETAMMYRERFTLVKGESNLEFRNDNKIIIFNQEKDYLSLLTRELSKENDSTTLSTFIPICLVKTDFRLYIDNNWHKVRNEYEKGTNLIELLNTDSNFYIIFKEAKTKDNIKYIEFKPLLTQWYDGDDSANPKHGIYRKYYHISFFDADCREVSYKDNKYTLSIT